MKSAKIYKPFSFCSAISLVISEDGTISQSSFFSLADQIQLAIHEVQKLQPYHRRFDCADPPSRRLDSCMLGSTYYLYGNWKGTFGKHIKRTPEHSQRVILLQQHSCLHVPSPILRKFEFGVRDTALRIHYTGRKISGKIRNSRLCCIRQGVLQVKKPFPITHRYSAYEIMAAGADSEPSLSTKRLEGKVAVITGGAATGIGRAAVRLFVAHGAFVLFGDIQDKLGAELALELAPKASFLHCDINQEKDVAALVDAAVKNYGRLDIMYNNAGIAGPRSLSIQDLDMAFMDFVYNVNVRGAILGTKHAARVMIPAKAGVILATASTASILGGVEPVPHNVGRLAMAGLIRSASAELGPHGIRVNCISSSSTVWTPASPIAEQREKVPGGTHGDAEESTGRSVRRPQRGHGVQGAAMLLPEDVARAALFLASDDARFISGLELFVDGDLVLGT